MHGLSLSTKKQFRNLSALDVRGIAWLSNSTAWIRAIETDKNLGMCLASTAWVQSQMRLHLAGYHRIDKASLQSIIANVRSSLSLLVDVGFQHRILKQSNARFLLQHANSSEVKIPQLRLNCKVHKSPPESRPISNMRGYILEPLAKMVNSMLLEVQAECDTVLTSSLGAINCYENKVMGSDEDLLAFDITSLYPSLLIFGDEKAVFEVVSKRVEHHFSKRGMTRLGSWLCKALKLLLLDPVVRVKGKDMGVEENEVFFIQRSGMTTGLSCASTIANIYLSSGFDIHVAEIAVQPLLRYIDDGIMTVMKQMSTDTILLHLNSWHPSVRVKLDDVQRGSQVHALDLQLDIVNGRVRIQTFRKKQSIYDYINPLSAHRQATLEGILHTEFHRLLLTNQCKLDFDKNVDIFRKNMKRRGHNMIRFESVLKQYPHWKRRKILNNKGKHKQQKTGPLKFGITVKYVRGLESIRWKSFNRCMVGTMSSLAKKEVKIFQRFSVGKNLFRVLYRHMW